MTLTSFFSAFAAPLISAMVQPAVITAAGVVAASSAGVFLQSRKSAKAQVFGKLLQTAAGSAYGVLALATAKGVPMSPEALVALETSAVAHGVETLKTMAAAQSVPLPDPASLAATVSGVVGLLKAADANVSAVPEIIQPQTVVAPSLTRPGFPHTALISPPFPVPVHVIGDATDTHA